MYLGRVLGVVGGEGFGCADPDGQVAGLCGHDDPPVSVHPSREAKVGDPAQGRSAAGG